MSEPYDTIRRQVKENANDRRVFGVGGAPSEPLTYEQFMEAFDLAGSIMRGETAHLPVPRGLLEVLGGK